MSGFVPASAFYSSPTDWDELQRTLLRALGERLLTVESYEWLRDAAATAMSDLESVGYSASFFDENDDSFVTYILRVDPGLEFEATFIYDDDEGVSLSLSRMDASAPRFMALDRKGVIVERDG